MAIEFRTLAPMIGAEVSGVDLSQPVDDATMAAIRAAWLAHVVLVFRGQQIDDDQQIAFSRKVGELELINMAEVQLDGRPEIYRTTNVGPNGELMPAAHPIMEFNKGNRLWHTDSSFKAIPAMASLLRAIVVPPEGGETWFANLTAAYEALPEKTKQAIEGLRAVHDFNHSRRDIENKVMDDDEKDAIPPVVHPVVRTHPETGRKCLYLASHAAYIEGMDRAEGRALLDELMDFATQEPFTYRHKWRAGELAMWDNRCALHRGTPFDAAYPRTLHRTTVAGTGPVT